MPTSLYYSIRESVNESSDIDNRISMSRYFRYLHRRVIEDELIND